MAPHQSTLDTLKKYADIHVQSAQQTFGLTLDYSESSVALLDQMIDSGWKGEQPENLAGVVGFFGAYLGEVVVRQLNGAWEENNEVFQVRIPLHNGDTGTASVFDKVKNRFLNGPSDSLVFFYQSLKRLQAGDLSVG